ncbi:MAG: nitroreductase family protein [Bacteroidales bacterium]|nr:nitroreductase family protein [Bacteroidales bacterium]
MADNYLENRYNEVFGTKKVTKRVGHTLDELLTKNRSTRGYYKPYVVKRDELERIVSVNTKLGSGCNRQVLRFRLVTKDTGSEKVLENIKMGAALPELHLPFPDTEPEAFIIVCSTVGDDKLALIDLGMSLQTMSLRAVEMGLNTLIVGAFNKQKIKEAFNLPCEPVAVLCVGKGIEKHQLVPIHENESHAYYRKDGSHYVPKVVVEDLIIG